MYNVPGRTGQDIPDHVVMDLAGHSNFLGVKECTGNERIQARPLAGPDPPTSNAGRLNGRTICQGRGAERESPHIQPERLIQGRRRRLPGSACSCCLSGGVTKVVLWICNAQQTGSWPARRNRKQRGTRLWG